MTLGLKVFPPPPPTAVKVSAFLIQTFCIKFSIISTYPYI